jgi:hypothetical protein
MANRPIAGPVNPASFGDRTPWLKEGGKGSMPRAVHIQFRPDPLAN